MSLDLRAVDLTTPGDGPYHVYEAARLPAAAPTYFVAASHLGRHRSEWWNNRMTELQATALCAALNAWWQAQVTDQEDC